MKDAEAALDEGRRGQARLRQRAVLPGHGVLQPQPQGVGEGAPAEVPRPRAQRQGSGNGQGDPAAAQVARALRSRRAESGLSGRIRSAAGAGRPSAAAGPRHRAAPPDARGASRRRGRQSDRAGRDRGPILDELEIVGDLHSVLFSSNRRAIRTARREPAPHQRFDLRRSGATDIAPGVARHIPDTFWQFALRVRAG